MYTIITKFSVKLTEKVVHGAEFSYKKVEKNTIYELKKWLKCRKQSIKGKKQQLVDRYVVWRLYLDQWYWEMHRKIVLSYKTVSVNEKSDVKKLILFLIWKYKK